MKILPPPRRRAPNNGNSFDDRDVAGRRTEVVAPSSSVDDGERQPLLMTESAFAAATKDERADRARRDDDDDDGETTSRRRRSATKTLCLSFVILVLVVAASTSSRRVRWWTTDDVADERRVEDGTSGVDDDDDDDSTCDRRRSDSRWESLKKYAFVSGSPNGAVATDHRACSELGVRVMRDAGGNAVDAAVAAALCLGVVNPASSGLGGGCFVLAHVDGATEVVDGRETAPAASFERMFEGGAPDASRRSGSAIGVPGELRALELVHRRRGRLSWAEVVTPAADLAERGTPVSRTLAEEIRGSEDKIRSNEWLEALVTNDRTGELLRHGEMMRLPKLAATLRAVAKEGADALYKGKRAQALAEEIQNLYGGIMTKEDIEGYRPVIRKPLVARNVAGFDIVGVPPPSSGGAAVIAAARFLAGYDRPPLSSFPRTLSQHRLVEALRHVFAVRMSLADPAFDANAKTREAVRDLVGPNDYVDLLRTNHTSDDGVRPLDEYGGPRWSLLQTTVVETEEEESATKERHDYGRRATADADDAQPRRRTTGFNYLEDHGTTHLSVVDKDRNAVAITSTINFHFGSGLVSPSTGIVFNNEMDDFSSPGKLNGFGLQPSEANYVEPHKRPLSSMSPTLVFRSRDDDHDEEDDHGDDPRLSGDDLFMVLGSSGGPKIISSTLQTLLRHALLGTPLFEAATAPRLHDQLLYHDAAVTLYDDVTEGVSPYGAGPSSSSTSATKRIPLRSDDRSLRALVDRGHVLRPTDYTGTVQAVAVDLETGLLDAVSDVRKNGAPAGY